MKKPFLFIGLLLAMGMVKAQNISMDFIPFHDTGYDVFQFENKILQQRDGDLVANVLLGIPSGDSHIPPSIVGTVLYKVSSISLQITDSMFVADTTTPAWYMFAQDPRGEGNLRVNIEPDNNGGTALRISHFSDDDLNVNHDEDVVAPLYDGIAFDYLDSYMMDSQGDLILKFYTENADGSFVCHIARCGVDGEVKYANVLPESQNFMIMMNEFESASKQYYQWKNGNEQNLFIYLLDSTFQMKNSYIINKQLYYKFYADPYYAEVMSSFSFGSNNFNSTFVIPDGEDVVVAAPYNYDSAWVYDFHECGAAVARYELRTMQRKALKYFNDQPGPSTGVNIMCFQKTSDGNLYLVYRETDSEYNPTMTAVKMDRNLNVIWKRYCYEPLSLKVDPNWSCYSDILKDENGNEKGIYIAGYSIRNVDYKGGIFFFFLTDDSLDDVGEGNMEVRPYSYYPNPAKDQLHLNYSPDVQPTKIELYDLQGRLVRTQSNGLENVNMQNFAAGQYLMRVILENGKVYTDKIVKE